MDTALVEKVMYIYIYIYVYIYIGHTTRQTRLQKFEQKQTGKRGTGRKKGREQVGEVQQQQQQQQQQQ